MAGIASGPLVVAGCASPAAPSPSTTTTTTTPVPDAPKLTCPAAQTIQSIGGSAVAVSYGTPTTANGSPPVTIACTPASGSVFTVGLSTVTCTATDAIQRTDTCSFPVTVLAPPRLAATSFLAFGDSLTRGENGESLTTSAERFQPSVLLPPSQTYPGVLQQALSSRYTSQAFIVNNAGCPGEGVITASDASCGFSSTLARFTSYTSSRLYEVALIMEGTNDLYQQRTASNIGPVIAGLQRMVGDARSRGVRPYLATIPPIDPLGSRGRAYGDFLVPQLNDRIRALGQSEGVTVVDVNQLVFGNSVALLSSDGLHPSAAAYAKIGDLFFTVLRSTLEMPESPAMIRFNDFRRPPLPVLRGR